MRLIGFLTSLALGFCSTAMAAPNSGNTAKQYEVARELYAKYAKEAAKRQPGTPFNEDAGRAFYVKKVVKDGQDYACASCHGDDPTRPGKHAKTGKVIKPLAIQANPEAFSSVAKAEKGFAKHCRDLYGNDCEPQDKGNFLTYLLSL